MKVDQPLFFDVMSYANQADRDVIRMVSGNPDWEPPEALREGLRQYADQDADTFQYAPSVGLPRLREQIAKYHNVSEDRVIITNGAGQANYLAMSIALDHTPSGEVFAPDPGYPYYQKRTPVLGGTLKKLTLDTDGAPDINQLQQTVSEETAAIILNSPNNPTGKVYTAETVKKIVELAEQNDVFVISDEVYHQFDYSGQFTSVLEFESSHGIMTNSFSKSLAITGFRVGYSILPEPLVEEARARNMLINVSVNRPGQAAVSHALNATDEAYFESNKHQLRERIDTFVSVLEEYGVQCVRPEGGFYVRVYPENLGGTLENAKHMIDSAGVAGMPSTAFGDDVDDWFRFALTTDRISDAAHRLGEYFVD